MTDIITYILFSYILSVVGFGIYQFLVRRKVTIQHRKSAIYIVLLLSLTLPLGLIQSSPLFYTEKPHTEIEFHNEPVLTKELLACYARTSSQDEFCHCEEVQQLNIIQYKENNFYNTFLDYESTIYIIFLITGTLVLSMLAFKFFQLFRFITTSRKEKRTIDGKTITILHTEKAILAASFRLKKRYIIWNTKLEQLSQKEQEAILQHEIAHLNHKDTWEQIGLNVLQIFWFFNPIYYLIKKELNLVNEFLADAFAVQKIGDVRTYANLILKITQQQQVGFIHQVAQHPIQARIIQLIEPNQKKSLLPTWLVIIGIFMLTTGWTTAAFVNQQSTQFEEYCHLQKEHKISGRKVFCKNCLFEDLN